ncbi:glycosyltransferase family 4 protein [Bacillus tianshenii]|uniref:glycosyltransferase family 4 protein n=1 Tax=Sutcliffiella tianshenii TaxID=1463404 RepID=UPI001CD37FAD|nr:glycosyltransferase family 4 protein [Bacillus tianshenii]MCA1320491.1 glycosyltransferase family 4 protein [Bacillus tianshenii]
MRILLVSNMYPSEEFPSYGVFVKNTESILTDHGYKVDRAVMQKSSGKTAKLIQYILHFLKVILMGATGNHDVIYVHYASHNALPLLLLKKIKKNVVIYTNVHGSDVVPEVASQEKYQPYVKRLLEASAKVITPSNYYRNLVAEKYSLDKGKIHVFPSGGVNKKVFYNMPDREAALKELKLSPELRYIGFVGRLDVGKGWDIFLKALKGVKDNGSLNGYKAIVVGSGKEQGKYEQMVKEFGLQEDIVYYPLLKQDMLSKVYNSIEVFCFPTTRKGESLGLVGLEAMACGVPVIGSRIGGLLDYIREDENGMLFSVGDEKELEQKLTSYLNYDEMRRDAMKKHALATAEKYEVNSIKSTLVEIFTKK